MDRWEGGQKCLIPEPSDSPKREERKDKIGTRLPEKGTPYRHSSDISGQNKKEKEETAETVPDPGTTLFDPPVSGSEEPSPYLPGELAEFVVEVAKDVSETAAFGLKQIAAIRQAIAKKRPTREELEAFVRRRVGTMDEFALKTAGSLLAAELSGTLNSQRKETGANAELAARMAREIEADRVREKEADAARRKEEAEEAEFLRENAGKI